MTQQDWSQQMTYDSLISDPELAAWLKDSPTEWEQDYIAGVYTKNAVLELALQFDIRDAQCIKRLWFVLEFAALNYRHNDLAHEAEQFAREWEPILARIANSASKLNEALEQVNSNAALQKLVVMAQLNLHFSGSQSPFNQDVPSVQHLRAVMDYIKELSEHSMLGLPFGRAEKPKSFSISSWCDLLGKYWILTAQRKATVYKGDRGVVTEFEQFLSACLEPLAPGKWKQVKNHIEQVRWGEIKE